MVLHLAAVSRRAEVAQFSFLSRRLERKVGLGFRV